MGATGCFFAAQPLKSIHKSTPPTVRPFHMPSVFALFEPAVDGKFDYLSSEQGAFLKDGYFPARCVEQAEGDHSALQRYRMHPIDSR